jgi:hypothetical protein
MIDKRELNTTTDKLEGKSKEYSGIPISNMTLKEVERCLNLQYDRHDAEIKNLPALPLPTNPGTQSKTVEEAYS